MTPSIRRTERRQPNYRHKAVTQPRVSLRQPEPCFELPRTLCRELPHAVLPGTVARLPDTNRWPALDTASCHDRHLRANQWVAGGSFG